MQAVVLSDVNANASLASFHVAYATGALSSIKDYIIFFLLSGSCRDPGDSQNPVKQ